MMEGSKASPLFVVLVVAGNSLFIQAGNCPAVEEGAFHWDCVVVFTGVHYILLLIGVFNITICLTDSLNHFLCFYSYLLVNHVETYF